MLTNINSFVTLPLYHWATEWVNILNYRTTWQATTAGGIFFHFENHCLNAED